MLVVIEVHPFQLVIKKQKAVAVEISHVTPAFQVSFRRKSFQRIFSVVLIGGFCRGDVDIAFLKDCAVVDKIIVHLKLSFVADRLPPPQGFYQEFLVVAETSAEYFLFSASPRIFGWLSPFLLASARFDKRRPLDLSSKPMRWGKINFLSSYAAKKKRA